jgi:hypothetical protein
LFVLQKGTLQWLKNGFALGYYRNSLVEPHMSMVGSTGNGEYHLQIRNVSLSGWLGSHRVIIWTTFIVR